MWSLRAFGSRGWARPGGAELEQNRCLSVCARGCASPLRWRRIFCLSVCLHRAAFAQAAPRDCRHSPHGRVSGSVSPGAGTAGGAESVSLSGTIKTRAGAAGLCRGHRAGSGDTAPALGTAQPALRDSKPSGEKRLRGLGQTRPLGAVAKPWVEFVWVGFFFFFNFNSSGWVVPPAEGAGMRPSARLFVRAGTLLSH